MTPTLRVLFWRSSTDGAFVALQLPSAAEFPNPFPLSCWGMCVNREMMRDDM